MFSDSGHYGLNDRKKKVMVQEMIRSELTFFF